MKTILAFLITALAATAEVSTITDSSGRIILGEIIGRDGPGKFLFRTHEGKDHSIALSRLAAESQAAVAAELDERFPDGVRVTSLVVKSVDGKYRYFFDVRNHSDQPWTGKVEVILKNLSPGLTNGKETLVSKRPMEPTHGMHFFIDSYTSPDAHVHGEARVGSFSWKAYDADGKVIASGEGAIAPKRG